MRSHAVLLLVAFVVPAARGGQAVDLLDVMYLGNAASEESHGLIPDKSEVRTGGLGQPCRVLLPTEPTIDRIANIRIAVEFTPSGQFLTRPEERNGPFVKPGTALATDGERLPLAAGPLGGAGDFYVACYGEYLVAMNCTEGKTFELAIPPPLAGRPLEDLVSGKAIGPAARHAVPPLTTLVLHLPPAVEPPR